MEFKEIIKIIPDVVWGAGLGSLITLFGVWLSNNNERKLRKEEREHLTKREIYLKAAEEITIAKALLMKIPTIDPSEIESRLSVGVELAKIHIIGNNYTVNAITELQSYLTKNFLSLIPQMNPISNLRIDINILNKQVDSSAQKQNQMLNEMTAYNLRGDTDPTMWKRLQENFEFHSNNINKFMEESKKKNAQMIQMQKELMIKCLEISIGMSELEIEAIKSVRMELDLDFDEEAYRKQIKEKNSELETEFSKFLIKIPNET